VGLIEPGRRWTGARLFTGGCVLLGCEAVLQSRDHSALRGPYYRLASLGFRDGHVHVIDDEPLHVFV
jgi:hypothetical protein